MPVSQQHGNRGKDISFMILTDYFVNIGTFLTTICFTCFGRYSVQCLGMYNPEPVFFQLVFTLFLTSDSAGIQA